MNAIFDDLTDIGYTATETPEGLVVLTTTDGKFYTEAQTPENAAATVAAYRKQDGLPLSEELVELAMKSDAAREYPVRCPGAMSPLFTVTK